MFHVEHCLWKGTGRSEIFCERSPFGKWWRDGVLPVLPGGNSRCSLDDERTDLRAVPADTRMPRRVGYGGASGVSEEELQAELDASWDVALAARVAEVRVAIVRLPACIRRTEVHAIKDVAHVRFESDVLPLTEIRVLHD